MNDVKPWEENPEIWKTEAAYMSWLRGGIRRAVWQRHPVKLEKIKRERKRIPNPNPRGKVAEVWGAECALCEKEYAQNQIEVDHIDGNHSLKHIGDIQAFVEAMAVVTLDDLQLVCKTCHNIKSYSDKQGISFEEARTDKAVIAFMKEKSVAEQKAILDEHKLNNNNSEARKEGIKLLFEKGILEI